MEIPTVAPNCLSRPNVAVAVAMSFGGMAAWIIINGG
jgi:hypothetical protein